MVGLGNWVDAENEGESEILPSPLYLAWVAGQMSMLLPEYGNTGKDRDEAWEHWPLG